MVREFKEETGVATDPYSWQDFGHLKNPAATVAMFMRFDDDVYDVQTMTDEAVELWEVSDLHKEPDSGLMTNLRWIIPSAVDKWEHNSGLYIEATL
jgi:8-oxo-dGTP pyrophosphatase MutT (NUDIX family)